MTRKNFRKKTPHYKM